MAQHLKQKNPKNQVAVYYRSLVSERQDNSFTWVLTYIPSRKNPNRGKKGKIRRTKRTAQ